MIRKKLAEYINAEMLKFWEGQQERAVQAGKRYKATQFHFARWLGIPAPSLSEILNGTREPSERTVHVLGRRLPGVYDAIGKPELRARAGMIERKQKRLARLASMAAKLDERDLIKLEQLARTLHPPDDDGEGDHDDAPFRLVSATR
jgi:hypothetical protein